MAASSRRPAFVLGLNVAGLAIVRALGRAGIPVVAVDEVPNLPAMRSRYCQGTWLSPDPVGDPAAVVRGLARSAFRMERPVLLAGCEAYATTVCRFQRELRRHFDLCVPPASLAELLVDKRLQHEAAMRAGIRCPATYYPRDAAELDAVSREVEYPAYVKPVEPHRWRARAKRGFSAATPTELVSRYQAIWRSGQQGLVQSGVPGPVTAQIEVSLHVGRGGETLAAFAARRIHEYPHGFGRATLMESVDEPAMIDYGARFLASIGYRGFASLEFKEDARSGEVVFIELNPELQSGLAIDAGVNFPLIAYLEAIGRAPPARRGYAAGVRWLRLPEDVKAFLSGGASPRIRWISQTVGARSFAIFATDDLAPLRWYCERLIAAMRRRAGARR